VRSSAPPRCGDKEEDEVATPYESQLDGGYDEAEAYTPEPGDPPLIGRVVDEDTYDGDYGTSTVLTIQPEDGEPIKLFCFGTVLADKVAKATLRNGGSLMGALVGAKYIGLSEKKPKAGRQPAKLWKFKVFESARGVEAPALVEAGGSHATAAEQVAEITGTGTVEVEKEAF
jgi:hypothetical protein